MKTLITLFIYTLSLGIQATADLKPISQFEKSELELISHTKDLIDWRLKMNGVYKDMIEHYEEANGIIDARDMATLRSLVSEFNEKHLVRFKEQGRDIDLLDANHTIETTTAASAVKEFTRYQRLMDRNNRRSRRGLRIPSVRALEIKINPNDELGEKLFRQFRLQLARKLVWLESFALGIAPLMKKKQFREVLIRDLTGESSSQNLEELWFEYTEQVVKTQHLSKRIEIFNSIAWNSKQKDEHSLVQNEMMDSMIKKNQVLVEIKKFSGANNFFDSMLENMKFMADRRWDAYSEIGINTLFGGSKIFGNTAGLFQSRNGFMYTWTKEQEEEITNEMRPLDVLFEKTPFRLTDKFIPGFYGHNAIWSGNEEELKELGVWASLKPEHQEKIRNGSRVIEALRTGVEFNDFRHFMDIDDFAAMRMRDCEEGESPFPANYNGVNKDIVCLNKQLKKEYLLQAFAQVGKEYDFAFDVNTEEKIVCSELLYRTFLDIDFEISLTVGQHNISPDQVAKKGVNGGPFNYFMIIHKGEYVPGGTEELNAFAKELLY